MQKSVDIEIAPDERMSGRGWNIQSARRKYQCSVLYREFLTFYWIDVRYLRIMMITVAPEDAIIDDASEDSVEEYLEILTICHD